MGKDTRSMSEAWSLWDRIGADDRVAFLPEPEDIEKEFRLRSRLSSPSSKVCADASPACIRIRRGGEACDF
jgi:hypothetical protein